MGAAWLWAACPVARGNGREQCTAWLPPPDRSQLNVFRPAQSWESNELCVCVKEKAIIGLIEWQIDKEEGLLLTGHRIDNDITQHRLVDKVGIEGVGRTCKNIEYIYYTMELEAASQTNQSDYRKYLQRRWQALGSQWWIDLHSQRIDLDGRATRSDNLA